MKISKSYLKQIIKEEINILSEDEAAIAYRNSLKGRFTDDEINDIMSIETAIANSKTSQEKNSIINRINSNKSQSVKNYFQGKIK